MVSMRWFLSVLAVAPLIAQTVSSPLAAGFRNESTPTLSTGSPSPAIRQPLSHESRGDIMMARKMYREAAETYALGPKDSPVLINKIGIAYHQMLQLDLARKHYERALKLDKGYGEAVNNLGTVYYARKNYRKAVGLYQRALKINPKSASIYSNLGTAQFARKKYALAMEAYEQALALDPEVFEHRSSQGVLLQERSVQERAKFHFYLAKTYAKAGAISRALLYLRKALEEGFKDRERLREDPEFASLQELPEFQQLLALEPRVL